MKNDFIHYNKNFTLNPWAEVYFVWLSHKASKSWEVLDAFCKSTNSGKIISELEDKCCNIHIYKTNLVRWVPLINSKIRYPNQDEKKNGLRRFIKEIFIFQPKIVYLFWKEVSDFVIQKIKPYKLNNQEYTYWETIFILAEHPSYIAVYKRKQTKEYIDWITKKIIEHLMIT